MDLKERYLTILKSIREILKNENQMHISSIKKKMDIILEDCIKLENEISKEKEWEVGGSGLTEEDKQEINNSLLELKSKIDNQDKKIDENSSQIDEIENNGVKVETVQNKVKEMAEAGQIQAYTIADKSIVASDKIADGSITQELISDEVKLGIQIDDENYSDTTTYSSKKIKEELKNVEVKDEGIKINNLNGNVTGNRFIVTDLIGNWIINAAKQKNNVIKFVANEKKFYSLEIPLDETGKDRFSLNVIDGMSYNFSGIYEDIKITIDGIPKNFTLVVSKGEVINETKNINFLATKEYVDGKTAEVNINQLNNSIFGNKYRINFNTGTWLQITLKLNKTYSGTANIQFAVTTNSNTNMKINGNNEIFIAGKKKKISYNVILDKIESINIIGTVDGMSYNFSGIYEDIEIIINNKSIPFKIISNAAEIIDLYNEISFDFMANKNYVLEQINESKNQIETNYMKKLNMYPLDEDCSGITDIFNGAIIYLEISGITNTDYKKGLFIRRLANSYSWATVAWIEICCGTSEDLIFSTKASNYTGEVTMTNIASYELNAINGHKGKLKIVIDWSKVTANSTVLYTIDKTLLSNKVIKNIIGTSYKKVTLPFPNNLYVVQGSKRKQAVPIFIDYLYNGTNNKILFENGEDRTYIRETVGSGNTQSTNIMNIKETLKYKSDTLDVADNTFNKISIRENTSNDKIFILIIGDSVTAGAITNKQYWAVAREFFAKEDIDLKRTSNVMFLGSNNCRTEILDYGGVTKEIKSCACGISSWSLTNWLTSASSHFVYNKDGTPTFSILKWIERYRTHDDNGNKLELGQGTGTLITSDNIDKIQCCTPNIVYINSTHNGGSIEQHEQMIEIIRSEIPDCKIIVGNPMPLTGTWHKEKYVGIDWLDDANIIGPNYDWGGEYGSSRIASLKYYIDKEKKNDWFFFMPQCVTMPTVEALEYDLVDCGVKQMKQVTKLNQLPKEHPSTLTHKIWGYELYALLKYISAINSETTTTNVVSVTLDTTEKTLNVEETFTLVATPSTEGTTVTFSSTNESIATIDNTGLVTAISEGECEIYAETSTSIFPAICKVTVNVTTESSESSDT